MNYANRKGIKFVALIGESELESGLINFKNMESGEQQLVGIEDIVSQLKGL